MKFKQFLALGLVLALPMAAEAHRFWVLPAATVLSGDDPWVTVDAAVSNDIFYFNHYPLKAHYLSVVKPDGSEGEMLNLAEGKHRTTFDLNLTEQGTYKVLMSSSGLQASWEDENGERKRWPGRGEKPAPGDFEKQVPKKAKNLKVGYSSTKLESFITAGNPTDTVLALSNKGLEMQASAHPNDLFTGEPVNLTFLMDGKAVPGVEVVIIPDGVRYRNSQQEIKLTTDKNGKVSVEWPQAGRYWLEAEYEDDQAQAPATTRSGKYIATLEVLPL
ncbi:DUF4198 domain-containing protein [Gilvimarinus agarilyticus]|uniref:DUF4198 domain-containing protein n=1 Tax=unclassified Gilvimarinus TaxID=2642066 RepID=UPI001C0A6731|nr:MULTISPECIES: DUF4198 domain-containing protein [unclassified Gilvimarinus]MBU2887099.1 DUF4198 domain-containing protein [Gilvimarinus agarilyticus]MDO6571758.1 DUF4198 domain-containing protein [Gilvimarinus sp. 2_MG-2023]MDO6745830.1 DUF4198 domain-containing protein [Gilvimarinus sp. 1_MG-2023]